MIYKKLKRYANEKIHYAYIGIFLAFLSALCSVRAYYYMYEFLQEIIIHNNMDAALAVSVRIIKFLILTTLIYFASAWSTHMLAFRLETNLKKEGLRNLLNASFSFFDKNQSGRVRKIIDDNTALTHSSVAHLIPDLSTAIFLPIMGIALAFYVDVKIGILFGVNVIVSMVLMKYMMGDFDFMNKYMLALERMNSGAVEYVRGIPVVKIFKTEIEKIKEFYQAIVDYSDLAYKYSMSCRVWFVIFQVFLNGAFLIYLLFAPEGGETRIFLTKFIFYALFNGVLFITLMKIMYVGMYFNQANTSIEKIENLIEEMHQERHISGKETDIPNFNIEFDRVTFAYEDVNILENFSLKLEENKTYALVGKSGSGKSTIAKLISGFYQLDEGQILIGGKAITKYSEKTLAKNIANVFQDARLFKTSIYENVKMGNPSATYEEVMKAINLAQADDILDKFQLRENTFIGSKGVHLSGGEIQRIAIARAILKDAGIIILDEASAAADPENEYELQKALSNLMKNKTVIMIAHRLSSIRNVDEILVVDEGKIVERGNHNSLMSKDSRYKKIYEEFMTAGDWRVK